MKDSAVYKGQKKEEPCYKRTMNSNQREVDHKTQDLPKIKTFQVSFAQKKIWVIKDV